MGTSPESYETATGAELYFKVDTGFLGLGKGLFIPASTITDVTGNWVTLSVDKAQLSNMGCDQRSAWGPEG